MRCNPSVLSIVIVVTLACALPSAADEASLEAMKVLPKVFRAAVDRIQPALVTIESFGGVRATQGRIGGIRKQGEGNTTGVMISGDGLIITSTFNFVTRPPVITVVTSDGKQHVAELLGRDDTRKICLLKIAGADGLPKAEVADVEGVQVGQWALSLGVGYGDLSPAVSTGIISAKNRIGGRAIQTDANISPANYGGPLIDLDGRLIGICVPLNPQSQAIGAGVEWYDSGIGFAIPLSNAGDLIARLKDGERIEPAFLGVRAVVDPGGSGVRVEETVQQSAAEEAGIQPGDVIVSLDGKPVDDPVVLGQMISRCESGQQIALQVRRSNVAKFLEMNVRLGSQPKPDGTPPPLEFPGTR